MSTAGGTSRWASEICGHQWPHATLTDFALLRELEPAVAANMTRHLAVAQEWLPHEWVPWSRGRDFTGDGGLAWALDQSPLPEAVRAAFEVNLLTEDNLPFFITSWCPVRTAPAHGATSMRRWTAEEARHATSIRDYLILTRAVDPVALERDRMTSMQAGWTAGAVRGAGCVGGADASKDADRQVRRTP